MPIQTHLARRGRDRAGPATHAMAESLELAVAETCRTAGSFETIE